MMALIQSHSKWSISFRKLISKLTLIYLTITKPDISFSVNCLSQFLAKHVHSSTIQSNIKILKYIKNTHRNGILYKRIAQIKHNAFFDVDWADFPTLRRFITSYCILLDNSIVSWKSKKITHNFKFFDKSENDLYMTFISCVWNYVIILFYQWFIHIFIVTI